MFLKQSMCVLCAVGFLCANFGIVSAKEKTKVPGAGPASVQDVQDDAVADTRKKTKGKGATSGNLPKAQYTPPQLNFGTRLQF